MSYLDNATVMLLCLVCKQLKELIWNGNGMETKLIRVFELHLTGNYDDDDEYRMDDPVRRFINNMYQYLHHPNKHRMLQQYQHWKITHEGDTNLLGYGLYLFDGERLTQNMSMTGIVSLDASSSGPEYFSPLFLAGIIGILPNLQQLDLSNVEIDEYRILDDVSKHCPRIEIIKWNFTTGQTETKICANGWDLGSMDNLKEVYFDNCIFWFDEPLYRVDFDNGNIINNNINFNNERVAVNEYEAMENLNKYPHTFFFHKVRNKPLQRLSIRNAHCTGPEVETKISQNVLIKFVRNAPSTLVWFRSDLSAANIQLLQAERPGIEFVQ